MKEKKKVLGNINWTFVDLEIQIAQFTTPLFSKLTEQPLEYLEPLAIKKN
jgi:hypothetical protein